jgi:hypothetical protein
MYETRKPHIDYRPKGAGWREFAAVDAMREFNETKHRDQYDMDALLRKLAYIGNVTTLRITHDKNEVPHLVELLNGIYFIDHSTGSVLCWGVEHDGVFALRTLGTYFFDGTILALTDKDISRVLCRTARQHGFFLWSPRLYTLPPLTMFAEEGSSRRAFARYVNLLTWPTQFCKTGGHIARVSTAMTIRK